LAPLIVLGPDLRQIEPPVDQRLAEAAGIGQQAQLAVLDPSGRAGNAHAGNLVDAKEGAWPVDLRETADRLDPNYSPASYAQLATAFTNSGDPDAANKIRYLGRETRGAIWCFCASLAQLLPVIPINKELTEFFNDPERTRLKGWQVFAFSTLGVVGLALGTILLVAVSGLTRSS
jgi:hypothetical protein